MHMRVIMPKWSKLIHFFYYLAYDFFSNDISGITGLAFLEERKLNLDQYNEDQSCIYR